MEVIEKQFIRPMRPGYSPKKIFAFDTEDDSRGRLKMGDIFNGKRHFTFYDRESIIEWFYNLPIPNNKRYYFFAHNLEYDLINVFKFRFDLIEYILWNNFTIYAKLKGRDVYFGDSLNLSYHAPLKRLGDAIGLPKLAFDPDSVEYLRRDVEIVYYYVEQLQNTLNKDYQTNLKYTIPSIAIEIFKKHFLDFPVERFISDDARATYFGGRAEAFHIGELYSDDFGGIRYSDINSSYPYSMMKDFPDTGSIRPVDSLDVPFGFARVAVEVDDSIPSLPVRMDGKIYFPSGIFRGIWNLEEIRHFRDSGGKILDVEYIMGTDKGFPYFEKYVKYFYEKKRDCDDPFYRDFFYKLFLNSLYGKFGEKLESKEMIDIAELKGRKSFNVKKIFGGKVIISDQDFESKNANVLWASYVTGYSRSLLHKNLKLVESKGFPLYCDTDSIIYKGNPGILDEGRELGQWKTENFKSVDIRGAKFYKMESETETIYRAKGIPADFQDIFFDYGYTAFQRPIKMLESMQIQGLTENQIYKIQNYWADSLREMITKYDKREVLEGGGTIPKSWDQIKIDVEGIKVIKNKILTLRNEILALGGLRKNKDVPNHFFKRYFYLFRRPGTPPDELVDMLNRSGWVFSDIDDFLDKIYNQNYLNFDVDGNSNFLNNLVDFKS